MIMLTPWTPLAFLSVVALALARGKTVNIFDGEGDILQLRGKDKLRYAGGKFRNAILSNAQEKWDQKDSDGNTVIPYVISGDYDDYERNVIQKAMQRIQSNTCIRFRPRTTEYYYIDILNVMGEGCYTSVGRVKRGRSILVLEANERSTCMETHIVQHELLHVTGLWHEHMRYDRDKYIKVRYKNIRRGYESQFNKVSPNEATVYNMPYDYTSVMHYGKSAFAAYRGAITMQTRDPQYMDVIGNVKDASKSDYTKVCKIYGCSKCNGGGTTPGPDPWKPKPDRKCVDKIPPLCIIVNQAGLLDCNGNGKRYCCGTCSGKRGGWINPLDQSYEDNYDDY